MVTVRGRPAERGMLYRDSQQNAYNRIQAVSEPQRTEEEARMKKVWLIVMVVAMAFAQ